MKNILITGCSSGIGLQTAITLKNNGYKVYASAKKDEDVQNLKDLGFQAIKLDVRIQDDITNTLNHILENDSKLDAVFNNAGFGQPGAIEDISTNVLRKQFETNVFGLHELTIQAMKIFREQGYGKIIQHSSVLGIISLRFRGAYNASKYAIEGLNDTLRLEVMNSDIFISSINSLSLGSSSLLIHTIFGGRITSSLKPSYIEYLERILSNGAICSGVAENPITRAITLFVSSNQL